MKNGKRKGRKGIVVHKREGFHAAPKKGEELTMRKGGRGEKRSYPQFVLWGTRKTFGPNKRITTRGLKRKKLGYSPARGKTLEKKEKNGKGTRKKEGGKGRRKYSIPSVGELLKWDR